MRGDMKIIVPIWAAFLTMLVMGFIVSAQYMPLYVGGMLTGTNVGSLGVTITNVRSGATQHFVTTGGGAYAFDAANFAGDPRYIYGDSFRIVVDVCAGNDVCERTVQYTGQSQLIVNLDLSDIVIPPTCRECPECHSSSYCGTCPTCETCSDCQTCPETTCPDVQIDCPVCPTAQTCDEPPACPVAPEGIASFLFGALSAGAAAIVLYLGKIKTGKKGEDILSTSLAGKMSEGSGFRAFCSKDMATGLKRVLMKHLHYGVMGYHFPDVDHIHSDPKYRHAKGALLV